MYGYVCWFVCTGAQAIGKANCKCDLLLLLPELCVCECGAFCELANTEACVCIFLKCTCSMKTLPFTHIQILGHLRDTAATCAAT